MKKTAKRLTALLLVTIMTALCILPVSAADVNEVELLPGIIVSTGTADRNHVQPRSQQIYSDTVGGSKRFTGGFACSPANGSHMRFEIENTGSVTIYVSGTITSGSEKTNFDEFSVPAGATRYITANKQDGSGLDIKVSFTLNTYSTTQGMYCNLYAEQY